MEPTSTIRIPNPSATLVAILENAHQQKKIRMKHLREKYQNAEKVILWEIQKISSLTIGAIS